MDRLDRRRVLRMGREARWAQAAGGRLAQRSGIKMITPSWRMSRTASAKEFPPGGHGRADGDDHLITPTNISPLPACKANAVKSVSDGSPYQTMLMPASIAVSAASIPAAACARVGRYHRPSRRGIPARVNGNSPSLPHRGFSVVRMTRRPSALRRARILPRRSASRRSPSITASRYLASMLPRAF
jgi:hypothetical protein